MNPTHHAGWSNQLTPENERVLELAALLEKLHPPRLVMSWDLPFWDKKRKVGCALGWALTSPRLRKEGLGTVESPEKERVMAYLALTGFGAVARFFGMTFPEVWSIFTPDGYKTAPATPQMVAARLRAVVVKKP